MTARVFRASKRSLGAVGVASFALVGACGGSGSPASAPPPSVPCGVSALDGLSVRRFCGTGTLSIRAGSVTTGLAEAECAYNQGGLTVNAGALVLGRPLGPATQLTYIGLELKSVAAAPGGSGGPDPTYRGLVSADLRGRVISVTDATVTLAGGGKTGGAQGSGRDGTAIAVTFSC